MLIIYFITSDYAHSTLAITSITGYNTGQEAAPELISTVCENACVY